MREVGAQCLWIGNAMQARDVRAVLALGIRAIVDLAANEPAIQYPRDIIYCRFPLHDGAGNESSVLRLAVTATATFIQSKIPTLVACSAGMSRSPAIVAAAFALLQKRAPDDVLAELVADIPHDVSPSLWTDVKLTSLKMNLDRDGPYV